MAIVEFYRMAIGGGVGQVVETLLMADFEDKDAFAAWAQDAIQSFFGS